MEQIVYKNADEAFRSLYKKINDYGVIYSYGKTLFNVGFYISDPINNFIFSKKRKWKIEYAQKEWEWYLSKNPNGNEIAKIAPIWLNHMDENGNIRSNYGWQWSRNNQIDKVLDKLIKNDETRQAVISIYDGKEIDTYKYDTPCTLSIHFQIADGELCMTVNMRSNDLWYGFCNDQYCFSKLQQYIASELKVKIGWYYHFSSNMHLYNKHLNFDLL